MRKGTTRGAGYLNKLLGNNATDGLSFMSFKPAKQREILAKLAGVDTAAANAKVKEKYNERTRVNAEKDRLSTLLNGRAADASLSTEEVGMVALSEELQQANAANRTIENLRRDIQDAEATRPP